jgi:DNA-binding PadR family transcriptional regulator
MEVVHQETRPNRKVYHITPSGRQALRNWLASPLPPQGEHSAELIQVFFSGQLTDAEVLGHFRRYVEKLRQTLAVYAKIAQESQQLSEELQSIRDEFFYMLTLECGIKSVQAQLLWAESVIERLEKKDYTLDLSVEK